MRPGSPSLRISAALLALLAGACVEASRDPFTATGEVIAMSGGDAGARNACFTCHGLRGEGDNQAAPRLAGLPAGYLQRQLQDYARGRRADEVMTPIAKALAADEQRAVSAYYATLPWLRAPPSGAPSSPAVRRLYHHGDATRGIPACAACHGASGEGLGEANPPLAGQPPAYLAEQLRRWRQSKRRNDPRDVMLAISRSLRPAEVEAISGYAAAPSPGDAQAAAALAASP